MHPGSGTIDHARPVGTMRVLKESRDGGVYLVRATDGSFEVRKRWRLTMWERCKRLLAIAQPQRQLRNARRLRAAGVATPAPIGGVQSVRDGPAGPAWLEIRLRWVEGEPLLDRVRGASEDEQGRLGDSMRTLLEAMGDGGLFHRDAKLSNFIVATDGAIVAIDPVGVRRQREPLRERLRTIESLACELSPAERAQAATFLARASPCGRDER